MRTVRIAFRKTGEAAYISHLDLQRAMARALRRSGMPVWYSQGFNPHIYMSFALPLPLLQESLCEYVDVKTESAERPDNYLAPLNAALPRGIRAFGMSLAARDAADITAALYRIRYPAAEHAQRAAALYNAVDAAAVTRRTKRGEQPFDLKSVLPRLAVARDDTCALEALLPAGGKLNVNPALLAAFLEDRCGLPAGGAGVTRMCVWAGDAEFC